MRIDRTAQKPSPPKALPWDNSGLRNRLQGQDLQEVTVDGLHALARDRGDDHGRRGRRGRVEREPTEVASATHAPPS